METSIDADDTGYQVDIFPTLVRCFSCLMPDTRPVALVGKGWLAPIYVTAGTGGANLQALDGQSQFVANQFSEIGFLNVNITTEDTGKQLQAAFDNSNNGTIMDRFSISKS